MEEIQENLNEHVGRVDGAQQSLIGQHGEKRKEIEPRSKVWKHFTKIKGGDPEKPRAKCHYCKKTYACHTIRNGTSWGTNHLKMCNAYLNVLAEVDIRQKVLASKGGSGKSDLVAIGFDKERARIACARMIIIDEFPFNHVEGEGFRDFCREICPRFDPPSRRTEARDVWKVFVSEKHKLLNFFKDNNQRCSITTDTWTSLQNLNYMVITAHFIDREWKLHKRILSFQVIKNHKNETIGKTLENCFKEWGIKSVFTISVDNASENKLAISFVKRKMNLNPKALVLQGEYMHVRCSAHVVSLIVKEGLKELHESIFSIRNAVRWVRGSPSRFLKFKDCVTDEKLEYKSGLVLDVATRWNSTFLMLESALKYQKAFERLVISVDLGTNVLEVDGKKKEIGPPSSDDWENAKLFVRFLRSFYNVTLKFSGSLSVTSSSFFREICLIQFELKKLCDVRDEKMSKMARAMKKKFDSYWGAVDSDKFNHLLVIPTVLDPRCKLDYVGFYLEKLYAEEKCEKMMKEIKNLLMKLFNEYFEAQQSNTSINDQSSSQFQTSSSIDCGSNTEAVEDDLSLELENQFKKRKSNKAPIDKRNEVERYLLDETENVISGDFDILLWWKFNASKYPVLSCIAKDVFAIQISTVASESAFSTSGRILDPYRSSLTPKMVEALICSQNWLRSPDLAKEPIDIDLDNIKFNEIIEQELVNELVDLTLNDTSVPSSSLSQINLDAMDT